MKKKLCYGLFFLLCIFVIQVLPAYADSGWHGSYGGSHSSGRRPSSSRYHSSSSLSGDIDTLIPTFVIIGVVVFICVLASKKQQTGEKIAKQVQPYDINKIKQILPHFDKNAFRMQVFMMYKEIEVAWMNFDYETLRKYVTDELYNQNHSQLIALQMKKQKNVMKDFELKAFEVVGMERVEKTIALKVRMTVECKDYVVDKENKVVRGTDKQKMVYDYEMTFVKGMDTKGNKCPNCNAPLENTNSAVCPYCDSVIISENYDWVLAKKQMVNQYRK